MNKKIFALAFVSVAFFFGCSADGYSGSNNVPPAWDNALPTTPSTGGPGGGGTQYCSAYIPGYGNVCEEIEDSEDLEYCEYMGGHVVPSCP
jgi:hypothetical protein